MKLIASDRIHAFRAMLGLLALVFCSMVSAQTTTGSIYGTVTDISGAVIGEASVIVTNIETGEQQKAQTSNLGSFLFPALSPGRYTVTVKREGFGTVIQKDIRLEVNQNVNASIAMKPGAASQSVTVAAATTLVDTRESQLGVTVDRQRISDLPLNGRDAYDLVQTVPGVSHFKPSAAIGDNNATSFSVNGNRINFDTVYLDGSFDTAIFRNDGDLLPNPDALQEFRLLTSNFDAEFGRSPGGVLNVITRSGTNAYHGLAYDYLRNNVLNAKNYFNNEVTPLKQNQFGGNFGGPIVRNKAFLFLSYEGLRIHTPAIVPSTLATLTPAEASGDFSALPASKWPKQANGQPYSCNGKQGVICPNLLDPVAQNLLKYIPLEDPVTLRPPEQVASANTTASQGMARADYQITPRHQVSAMFFTSHGSSRNPQHSPNQILDFGGSSNYASQTNAVVSERWIISANALNSLRVSYTLNHTDNTPLFNSNWSTWGSQIAEGAPVSDQPEFDINGYWKMGLGGNNGNENERQQAIGVLDTFNWIHGKHSIKAGGSFIWNQWEQRGVGLGAGHMIFTGSATKNAVADFLLGRANSFQQNAGDNAHLHEPDPALFVQDDWTLTHRLTLDLGLRWEEYAPYAGQNDMGTFVPYVQSQRFPSAPLGLLSTGDPGISDGILHVSWKRFAPRVGFAYDVFGNGTTSLRGAYGVFYAVNQETFSSNLEQQPFLLNVTSNAIPNMVAPYGTGQDPFPYHFNPSDPIFASGATVFGLRPNESTTPYVQEYNLTLEQQLGANWAAQIAYIGSVSRELNIIRDENSPAYVPGASISTAGLNARRPYEPTPSTYVFGRIIELDPESNASFNSLQASITRRFSRGFSLKASYVWEKAMDNVSADPGGATQVSLVNENDAAMDWGPSSLEVPQQFIASYLWATPRLTKWGVLGRQVLSNWQFNGITTLSAGSPFTVTSGVDTNLDGTNNDRPNLLANPLLTGSRSRQAKIQEFFNTDAFGKLAAGVPYGNVRRNSLLGPGYMNTDFSIFRMFPVWRESSLQLRGEVFNLFNSVNLDAPVAVMSSPKFGVITGSGSPRIVQLALRYSF